MCVLLPERPFKYLFKLKLLFNIFLLYVESSVMICVLLLKRKIHGSGINVIQYSPEVKRKMSSSGALNHSCAISYSLTLTASFISRCLQSFLLTISSKETVWDFSLTVVLWGKQLSSSFSTLHIRNASLCQRFVNPAAT